MSGSNPFVAKTVGNSVQPKSMAKGSGSQGVNDRVANAILAHQPRGAPPVAKKGKPKPNFNMRAGK